MNQLFVIRPYKQAGTWVFDDISRGLMAEPFVSGIPEIIDRALEESGIDEDQGFTLTFSRQRFPHKGPLFCLTLDKEENDGAWYRLVFDEGDGVASEMKGWLCPALFKYFRFAPDKIYVGATAAEIPNGKMRAWAIRNPPSKPDYFRVGNLEAAIWFIAGLIQADLNNAWVQANAFGLEVWQNGGWEEWEDHEGNDILHYVDQIEFDPLRTFNHES